MSIALKWIVTFLGIVLGGALLLYGCAPWASVHYKLSIVIDDNGKLYNGSGVIEAHFQSQGPVLVGMSPPWSSSTTGEAFAIDVGARGTVFVLLVADRKTNQTARWPNGSADAGRVALEQYLRFDLPARNCIFGARNIWAFAGSRRAANVPPAQLPLLIWFKDPALPSTIKRIDPDRLDAVLGPGVTIKSAQIEITDQPASRGIETRLPWLRSLVREGTTDLAEAFHQAAQGRGVLKLADAVPNSDKNDRFPWVVDSSAFRKGM